MADPVPTPGAPVATATRHAWGAALLYAALTALLAYPLTRHPASMLMMDAPDTHLFMWTLGWDVHAFTHAPLDIFNANIYFPQRLTLAYSENLIGSAFMAAPVLWLSNNPVLALNVVVLASTAACGLGAYLLALRVGLTRTGALLCGLVFAFAPARYFRITQLHLATVQWVPFTLAYLHAYLATRRPRDLRLAAAFFSLQALTSGHGAAYALLSVALLGAHRLALGEPLALGRRARDLGAAGVLLLVPSVLVYLPYRSVESELGLARSLEDWTPRLESYIASPATLHAWLLSWLPGPPVNETANAFLFPGFVPLLLAVAALTWRSGPAAPATGLSHVMRWSAWLVEAAAVATLAGAVAITAMGPMRGHVAGMRVSVASPLRAWVIGLALVSLRLWLRSRVPFAPAHRISGAVQRARQWVASHRDEPWRFYGVLTVVCLWLSAGTPLHLWSWVNGLPGLSLIRVPSRFMILGTLGLAILAGRGFDVIWARVTPGRRRVMAIIVGVLMVGEFSGIPLELSPFRVDPPAIDRWLDGQPKPFVVAEAPVGNKARFQTTYMLHATAHWQRTVHGYSGAQAPIHDTLFEEMRAFPNDRSLTRLEDLGVTFVVVHPELYSRDEWAEVDGRLPQFAHRLRLVHELDGGRVYALARSAPPH